MRRLALLTYLVIATALAQGLEPQIAAGWLWYDASIAQAKAEKFVGPMRVAKNGSVSYVTVDAFGKTSLWMSAGVLPVNWIRVARDGDESISGLLLRAVDQRGRISPGSLPPQVECAAMDCFFGTTSQDGARKVIWRTKAREGGFTSPEKFLDASQTVNLGQILALQGFGFDDAGERFFVIANIGNVGLGFYEMARDGNFRQLVNQERSQTTRWDDTFWVGRDTVVFHARKEVKWGSMILKESPGLFRADLRTGLVEPMVLAFESRDPWSGKPITACCDIAGTGAGLLIAYHTGDGGDLAKVIYWQDGKPWIRVFERPNAYFPGGYIPGARPLPPRSWSLIPFVVSSLPLTSGVRRDELYAWEGSRAWSAAATGDKIYPQGGSFEGFGAFGGSTMHGIMLAQTFSWANGGILVRFAAALKPTVTSISPSIARPGDTVRVTGFHFFPPDTTSSATLGGFPVELRRTADGAMFSVPPSVPSGKNPLRFMITAKEKKLDAEAGHVEVVNTLPLPRISGLGSAATFPRGQQVAPGGLATLFGANLTPHPPSFARSLPLPQTLGSTQVLVNGLPAALIYLDAGQVNFQVPWELAPGSSVVQVKTRRLPDGTSLESLLVPIQVAASAPALFENDGQVIIVDAESGEIVGSRSNPARRGANLLVFGTGFGPTSPPVPSGEPAPLKEPLVRLLSPPRLMIGGVERALLFGGLAPGQVSLCQFNFQVPQDVLEEEPVELIPGVHFRIWIKPDPPPQE